MLPEYYKNIKYANLDTLYKCLDRCRDIIKLDEKWPGRHYVGYARTAKIYIPGYEARIVELRAEGYKTIMEEFAECTGNTFIPLERGGANIQQSKIRYAWPT